MDSDGYPDKDELEKIKSWNWRDGEGLLEYVAGLWHWDNYAWQKGKLWFLSTGGWSGNEELIDAMQENLVWWMFHWYRSTRGGHYEFQPRDKE